MVSSTRKVEKNTLTVIGPSLLADSTCTPAIHPGNRALGALGSQEIFFQQVSARLPVYDGLTLAKLCRVTPECSGIQALASLGSIQEFSTVR